MRKTSPVIRTLTRPARKVLSGRQKLMEAALELAANTRSWAALGLREVARQAGLNPNTFYRHFQSFDELGLAVIGQLSGELRNGLRERRQRAAARGLRLMDPQHPAESLQRAQDVVRESVGLVLDFIADHRKAYVVGIRELHGNSPVLRRAMRKVMDDIANDMAEDVLALLQQPLLDAATVHELAQLVIRQMSLFALDYVEHPEQREEIRRQAERFILLLFWGALAARAPKALAASKLQFPDI